MRWGIIRKEHQSDNKHHEPEEQPEKKGLSDKQKKALVIGASVVVAGLAIYGGYKLQQSGKLAELSNIGKSKLEASIDEQTGFRKMKAFGDIKVNKVNPEVRTTAVTAQ